MCFWSSGGGKEPPAIQEPAKITDQNVTAARDQTIAKQRAAAGANSTILTQGKNVQTTSKTLLGQ